jgi:hypothetical protein
LVFFVLYLKPLLYLRTRIVFTLMTRTVRLLRYLGSPLQAYVYAIQDLRKLIGVGIENGSKQCLD